MKKLTLMAVLAVLAVPVFAQSWSKDLEKTAKGGDVEAQLTVGNAYLTGDGVKQNAKKAAKWLFMAAEAGNADAATSLCTFYSKELEKLATAGNANAQFAMAGFLEAGNGVKQNPAKAFEWYGKAAAQGIAEAKSKVIGSYNAGLEILAAAGDADAQFALAGFLESGNGVKQNPAKAFEWYGKAAAQGIAEAKSKVIGSYNAGLEILAAAGDADAQFALAGFLEAGNGVAQDQAKALEWYGLAAGQGKQEARAKVVGSYNAGLIKLAESGDADAMTELANYLLTGTGGATKDEAKAANCFAYAYKFGNTKAGEKMWATSRAYYEGRGVDKNEGLGALWLANAASAGHPEAAEKFYSTDSPYLRQAADNGDPKAMVAVAKLWENYDYNKALDYYAKAAQAGEDISEALKGGFQNNPSYSEKMANVFLSRTFEIEVNEYDNKKIKQPTTILNPDFAFLLLTDKKLRDLVYSYSEINLNRFYLMAETAKILGANGNAEAQKLYDDWYFQGYYESFEIFKKSNIVISGFKGIEKVIINNGKTGSSLVTPEKLTEQELQELTDAIPDFSINPNDIRVLRDIELNLGAMKNTVLDGKVTQIHKVDMYYLPGIVAVGPKSQLAAVWEPTFLTKPTKIETTVGEYTLLNDPKAAYAALVKNYSEKYKRSYKEEPPKDRIGEYSESNFANLKRYYKDLPGEDRTEEVPEEAFQVIEVIETALNTSDFNREQFKIYCIGTDQSDKVDIDSLSNYNFTLISEFRLSKNTLEFVPDKYEYGRYSGGYKFSMKSEFEENGIVTRFEPNVLSHGAVGVEYIPLDYSVTKADGSCAKFRWDDRFGQQWFIKDGTIIEVSKPDHYNVEGDSHKIKDYKDVLYTLANTPVDSIPSLLAHCYYAKSADIGSDINTNSYTPSLYNCEYAKELYYGRTKEEQRAIKAEFEKEKERKEKEKEKERMEQYWANMTKEYGQSQVNKFRNSKSLLVKGVNIGLVDNFINNIINAYETLKYLEHWRSDSDGNAIYDLYEGNSLYGYTNTYTIYTKDGIIYHWVKR